jgi:hypothetical protein
MLNSLFKKGGRRGEGNNLEEVNIKTARREYRKVTEICPS